MIDTTRPKASSKQQELCDDVSFQKSNLQKQTLDFEAYVLDRTSLPTGTPKIVVPSVGGTLGIS